jgi:hypothetical protein
MKGQKLKGFFIGCGYFTLRVQIASSFTSENGYLVEAVLQEVVPGGAWYAVQDPERANHRIEPINDLTSDLRPTVLYVR